MYVNIEGYPGMTADTEAAHLKWPPRLSRLLTFSLSAAPIGLNLAVT